MNPALEHDFAALAAARDGRWVFPDFQLRRAMRAGDLETQLRGRGLSYAQSRPYRPGDDVRHIDWKLTARSRVIQSKEFHPEGDKSLIFWIDQTPGMWLASKGSLKAVVAGQVMANMAWQAVALHRRVGGVMAAQAGQVTLKPRAGAQAVLALLGQLCQHRAPSHSGSSSAWRAGLRDFLMRRSAPVQRVIISHFLDMDQALLDELRATSQAHPSVLVHVLDPLELEPNVPTGDYPVQYQDRVVGVSARQVAEQFCATERVAQLKALAHTPHLSYQQVLTDAG